MTNAYDYIRWRGDLPFGADPVNEVDLFLCAQLSAPSYTDFLGREEEMTLKDAARHYFSTHTEDVSNLGVLQSKYVLPSLRAMAESRRFEDLLMIGAESRMNPEKTEQFEAVTFRLDKDLLVVSYRGTDDTLVGWKEDCYLAVLDEVPAQKDALRYLERIARRYPEDRICVVGHSKGGNLAIYAAIHASMEVQERIVRAVGFDNPGFQEEKLYTPEYQRIEDRIVTVISQNSLVGMLMNPAGRRALVHAAVKGPLAHDGYTWEVVGRSFTREKKLSKLSSGFASASYATLEKMSTEQRKQFVDEVFDVLESTGARTITDLVQQRFAFTASTFAKLAKNPEVRSFLGSFLPEAGRVSINSSKSQRSLP